MKINEGKDKFLGGLTRKNPMNEGDASRKLPTDKTTVNDGTRENVAKSRSIGGRVA